MESAVFFYDRVPNRFTRTSIAPHETMDFSLGSMPLEYPYPPSLPSKLSLESIDDEPFLSDFETQKRFSHRSIDREKKSKREEKVFWNESISPQKRDDEASKSRLTIPVKGVYLRSNIYYE